MDSYVQMTVATLMKAVELDNLQEYYSNDLRFFIEQMGELAPDMVVFISIAIVYEIGTHHFKTAYEMLR